MSGGAFRDASAALERAAVLEAENQSLHEELVQLRTEVEKLRGLLEQAAGSVDPDIKVKILEGERESLLREVKQVDDVRHQLAAERTEKRTLTVERNEMGANLAKAKDDLARLHAELADLREELAAARRSAEKAWAASELPAVPPNADAYTQRVQEERDELLIEVRKLREANARVPRPSFLAGLFRRR